MSSMFKKKGGMAFKPKMSARPRAPGAASSQPPKAPSTDATDTPTQPEPSEVSNDSPATNVADTTAGAKAPARIEPTDTPPTSSSNAIQTATPQSQEPADSTTISEPVTRDDTASESTTQSGGSSSTRPAMARPSVTPAVNASQPSSTTPRESTAQHIETSTPAQLQTPPATAPSANEVLASTETPADSAAEAVNPPANNAAKAPTKRARKRAPETEAGEETEDGGEEASAPKPKRLRKKDGVTEDGSEAPKRAPRPRKKRTAEDGAAAAEGENGEAPAHRARRPPRQARSVTPEDAEEQEADLSVLTMGDLTRDLRIGKKFSRHDELLQRHREKQAKARERLKNRRNGSEDVASESGTPAPPGSGEGTPAAVPVPKSQPAASMGTAGPQFQIIDGQIVVDQNSLALDRHAIADANAEDMLEIEENDFTSLTTQNSYRTGSKLKGPNVWTEEETELFYRGLRMFGTDFQMISGMFPGKNRRHVKMKFNREERHAPARIDAALVGKKELQIDLEEYKTWTKAEYEPVEAIMAVQRAKEAEFDAEQAKIQANKDAINARKRAALEDPPADGSEPAEAGSSSGGGKARSRPQANVGPQITVDADGMITIDETNMEDSGGKKKRGAGKAKKKAVEYNMRGEIIG
ncbi:myb-like DNA-binding domain-containing protein [Colletotrichum plurivorum]|uniref:Myb-like DNA-binding domain-containing protein n=1 Tax=Colletotrichum plurivorum TaxID=2175906 RepID=A0A8H6KH48_9PEZI|nr:myb-like DNA-binding domain-containing protein [Colletotrichum plurivorum]